jgi:hypothetical protein
VAVRVLVLGIAMWIGTVAAHVAVLLLPLLSVGHVQGQTIEERPETAGREAALAYCLYFDSPRRHYASRTNRFPWIASAGEPQFRHVTAIDPRTQRIRDGKTNSSR